MTSRSVYNKVYAAVENALSSWEKTKVYFGWLDLDDFMGSDFKRFPDIVPTSFTLSFKGFAGDLIIGNLFTHPPQVVNPPVEYEILAISRCKPLLSIPVRRRSTP